MMNIKQSVAAAKIGATLCAMALAGCDPSFLTQKHSFNFSSSYKSTFNSNGNNTIEVNNSSSSEGMPGSTNGKGGSSAMVPKPIVYVATSDNCASTAVPPTAPAGNLFMDSSGANRFMVKIADIDRLGVKQQTQTLCWAACTEVLLRQQQIQVDQDELSHEYLDDDANGDNEEGQAAGLGVMIRALNPDLQPQVDARGSIPIDFIPLTSDQMLAELMSGRLCIVGLVKEGTAMGHACVVCGAQFARLQPNAMSKMNVKVIVNGKTDSNAADAMRSGLMPQYGLYQVDLFDPRTGTHVPMSGQDFQNEVVFLTSHQFARDILLAALQAPPVAASQQPVPGAVVIKRHSSRH